MYVLNEKFYRVGYIGIKDWKAVAISYANKISCKVFNFDLIYDFLLVLIRNVVHPKLYPVQRQ